MIQTFLPDTLGDFNIKRYQESLPAKIVKEMKKITQDGLFLEYNGEPKTLSTRKISYSDDFQFYISPISEKNLFSVDYFCCSGLIMVGENEEGNAISLLTHQHPNFSSFTLETFSKNLENTIVDFKKKCHGKNPSIGFFGGMDYYGFEGIFPSVETITKNYNIELQRLTHPLPTLSKTPTDIFVDNMKKTIYIIRSQYLEKETSGCFHNKIDFLQKRGK